MRNGRFLLSEQCRRFSETDTDTILGMIMRQNDFSSLQLEMRDSWEEEIAILKHSLHDVPDGLIVFEYSIPRLGKRIDTVLLLRGIVIRP